MLVPNSDPIKSRSDLVICEVAIAIRHLFDRRFRERLVIDWEGKLLPEPSEP